MIEKMKKLTLLVSEREREGFISGLKKVGVLHIKHVKASTSHEIGFLEEKISKVEHMILTLNPYICQDDVRKKSLQEKEIIENIDKVEELSREKQNLQANILELEKSKEWFEPWGEFDPEEIEALTRKGVYITLHCLQKDEFDVLKDKEWQVIKKQKDKMYVATITTDAEEAGDIGSVQFPQMGPKKIEAEIEKANKRTEEIDAVLKEEALALGDIEKHKEKLQAQHEFLKVKFGMQEEEEFAYLQGFCPAKAVKKIIGMTNQYGAGYLIEEVDDPEAAPTLITNPGWIKIINPVFQFMNTLPGYDEFDISLPFMVFFSLFFAMLIGDAGYGLLFLGITLFAQFKLRKKNLPREPFFLVYLLSIATIIWGAISGTWFGAAKIAQLPVLKNMVIGPISSFNGSDQNLLIYICFLIGGVQLTLAHTIRGAKVINSLKAFAEVGWIMIVWGMFFAAGLFVIGRTFPPVGGWMLTVGIIFVLFFSSPEKGIIKGALSTMANLPLSVISSFSDVVSYLRLFAVGYASVVVAASFNNMALEGGIHSVAGGIIAALILFAGHTLNIVLGVMAVVVHGIRLNMLEFSGHLGMQWSGKKYEPFCEK